MFLEVSLKFSFLIRILSGNKTRVLNLRNGKGSSHLKTKFPEVVCMLAEKSRLLATIRSVLGKNKVARGGWFSLQSTHFIKFSL